MSEAFNALPGGYTLLEYRIESMLGAGGFGLTYLAHDANLNTKVAIKEYLPSDFAMRSEDQSVLPKSNQAQQPFDWGLKRFLDESRTLASFRHPNIVRVMRFFEANCTAYMVMEFIAGKPLNEWVRERTTLDQAGLLNIATPLLDGLDVIHQAGYLHRDIKPPNIFIRGDGSPILIDFGSARMKANANQELTAIVTPGFSPLEQYHANGKQGPWTDLYSFAGVLYWLVTGVKPVEAAARERTDPMQPAAAVGDRRHYSAGFLEAIDWALRPLEQDRPQSVAAWRTALVGRESGNTPTVQLGIGRPAARPVSADAGNANSMPSGVIFDRDTLKRIETELAAHLGPIAGMMVRNAARKAATVPELAALLAPEIAEDRARVAFTRKFSGDNSMPLSRPGQGMQTAYATSLPSEKINASLLQRFDPETLHRAETALAQYIGAIARIVVKRAAQKARDEHELYLILGDEIEDKTDRKNFVRKVISLSGKN